MKLYHKIQSIYYRDPENNYKTFIDGKFSMDAFELLQDLPWDFTEKIDGTNIRIGWNDVDETVTFGGRSDRAELPDQLRINMQKHFTPERMAAGVSGPVTLIGEGYGGKIQKGHGYGDEQRFILFDVFIEPTNKHPLGIFLTRDQVQGIGNNLEIPVVQIIHTGPLLDGIGLVDQGLASAEAGEAEGVVARPCVEMYDRLGRRVITKIKVQDYS